MKQKAEEEGKERMDGVEEREKEGERATREKVKERKKEEKRREGME